MTAQGGLVGAIKGPPPGVIDVHAHWLPEDLFSLSPGSPLPGLESRGEELYLGDLPLSIEATLMSDPERVLADIDEAGLAARVLSAPPFAFPVVDHLGVDEYVGRYNEAMADVCRASDGRLWGLGLVSLHDPSAARRQMLELRRTGVLLGISVPPIVDGTSFHDGPLGDVAACAAELGLAMLVHPMQLPRPEWSSFYLANLLGNPVETATAVASLVLGGVIEALPSLRICFVHGGGCAAGVLGRWEHGWNQRADVRAAGGRSPRVNFREVWFDTLTHDEPTLRQLAEHASPQHLLCGSDYPFDMGLSHPQHLPLASGITADALERNARLFLGLSDNEGTH